jgi:carbon storage regulator
MLVLSRRIGERIVIDDQIVLEVLEIKGNRIRLGIQAPPGSSILREELLEGRKVPADEVEAAGHFVSR